MTVYFCQKCSMVTEKKRCLLCGGVTVKHTPAKKARRKAAVKAKGPQRFPREHSKAEVASQETISIIEQKCLEFDCPGRVTEVKIGPVVTQFNFIPKRFVRAKRIRGMHEDLSMALKSEVTITRIPGEGGVSIMVPNKNRKIPSFDDSLRNVIAVRNEMDLPLNFGVDSLGKPLVEDLARMPHLLVAGSTGAGKSVFLNCLITSLLYVRTPKQMQLVLFDPKTVELYQYKGLPHVKREPVGSHHDILREMEHLNQEMRRRMTLIHFKDCKNLKELNSKVEESERLPYIVVVLDEMSDIIINARKEFTQQMAQISSIARAAGIHVIAATQRPSVDVLRGSIKVNFPARVAFRVPSQGDSRTILGSKGAEQLMDRGDAFYSTPDRSGFTRVHVPMVTSEDVKRMIKLSIATGHHLSVPADMKVSGAELQVIEDQQKAEQQKSLADLLEQSLANGKIVN